MVNHPESYILAVLKYDDMDKAIQDKVDQWLNGPFDEETKAGIRSMQQKQSRMNWPMHFIKTWNLVPADFAGSWGSAPTG